MNNNYQTTTSDAQCCVDYCETSFSVDGKEMVNNYKCGQETFSSSQMWNLEKSRQTPAIEINIGKQI